MRDPCHDALFYTVRSTFRTSRQKRIWYRLERDTRFKTEIPFVLSPLGDVGLIRSFDSESSDTYTGLGGTPFKRFITLKTVKMKVPLTSEPLS